MNKRIFDDIIQMYSGRATDMMTAILNNETFIQTVQKMLIASLEFRDLVQKTTQAAFEQLNIPTGEDFEKLTKSQIQLEERLFAIEELLENIDNKLNSPKKPKAKKANKAASKGKKVK